MASAPKDNSTSAEFIMILKIEGVAPHTGPSLSGNIYFLGCSVQGYNESGIVLRLIAPLAVNRDATESSMN